MEFSFDALSFKLPWREISKKFEKLYKRREFNQIRAKYAEFFRQDFRDIIYETGSDGLLAADLLLEDSDSEDWTGDDLVSMISKSISGALMQNVSSDNTVSSSAMDLNPSSVGNLSSKNEISGDSATKLSMTQDEVSTCHAMNPNPSTMESSSSLTASSSSTQDSCPEENSDDSSSAVASLALDGAISTSASADENHTASGNAEGSDSARSCLVNEHELPMERVELETDEGMLAVEGCESGGTTHSWIETTTPRDCLDDGVNCKNLPEEFEDVDLSDRWKDDEDFQYAFISLQESRPSSLKKKLESSIVARLMKMRGRKETSHYRSAVIREEEDRQGSDLPPADSKKNCCAGKPLELEWEML